MSNPESEAQDTKERFMVCGRLFPLTDPPRYWRVFQQESEALAFLREKEQGDPTGSWRIQPVR